MIVVVIVPVMVGVPPAAVFVPPFVIGGPATLASFMQLMASAFCLFAFPTIVFGRFVEPVVGLGYTVLAFVFIGPDARSSGKNQEASQGDGGDTGFAEADTV